MNLNAGHRLRRILLKLPLPITLPAQGPHRSQMPPVSVRVTHHTLSENDDTRQYRNPHVK
jgi:hypothetical protein